MSKKQDDNLGIALKVLGFCVQLVGMCILDHNFKEDTD